MLSTIGPLKRALLLLFFYHESTSGTEDQEMYRRIVSNKSPDAGHVCSCVRAVFRRTG